MAVLKLMHVTLMQACNLLGNGSHVGWMPKSRLAA